MRIRICGGGPGGLYLAILLARSGAGHEITVSERNAPGATYGWGVVFSDDSLAELRDADYETYLAIDEALVRWSAIDVVYGGERIRSTGHGFAAIARRSLLAILAGRAAALGVDLRYEDPVTDPPALAGGCDLLVGADGIRSEVRAAWADRFGAASRAHRSRYVWYGADLALPVFTFIIRPTEFGLFQVHAYPFDAGRSTFIVEASEEAWRKAGLDRQSEGESLAFCQEMFAAELGGHRLLGNKSEWGAFTTLRNRSWHHRPGGPEAPAGGHVVLLGDAAHTAHFSIGSGTRLALDDAIVLAKALVAHPGDLPAALAAYEGERQPVVERFQEVAGDSARYFEQVGRHLGFEPWQFAFNLLTRSGRIGRLELERRDPVLTNRVDREFAASARVVVPPPLHAPLRLATREAGPPAELPNRVALAPAAPDSAEDGLPSEAHDVALVRAAAAGAGLVVTEAVAPSPEGRVTSGSAGLWSEAQAGRWAEIVAAVQAEGARIALRLTHAGRRGATLPRRRGLDRPLPPAGGWRLLGPSPLPYAPWSRRPRPVDGAARAALARAHTRAAGLAAAAGFDLLILDMSDGYLLASFLSPLANQRADAYGGDLDGRALFPFEILEAVSESWPATRPLAVRLLADDRLPGGLTPGEGVDLAGRLAARRCALVDVAAGMTTGSDVGAPDFRRAHQVPLADQIRNEGRIPVMVGGHITRFDQVNTVLAAGRADVCVLDPRSLAAATAAART